MEVCLSIIRGLAAYISRCLNKEASHTHSDGGIDTKKAANAAPKSSNDTHGSNRSH